MYKLSCWASQHRYATRFIIVLLHCLLWALAFMLVRDNIVAVFLTTPIFLGIVSALNLIIIVGYRQLPRYRATLTKQRYYVIRKTADFLLCSIGWVLLIGLMAGINNKNQGDLYGAANIHVRPGDPTAQQILNSLSFRDRKTLSFREKRILKKELQKQVGIYVGAHISGDKQKAVPAGQIIITIILAVGLLFLLSALACNLSCSGNGGAAAFVFVLGLVGIIFLMHLSLRKTPRRKNRVPPSEPVPVI